MKKTILLALVLLASTLAHASGGWIDPGLSANSAFPSATPEEAGLTIGPLQDLVDEAEKLDSDALIVIRGGKTVVERYFGKAPKKIASYSVTKSVASLGIGLLVDDGKIPSLDTLASRWFPEWASHPRKSRITLRMLLTHTSGMIDPDDYFEHREDLGGYFRSIEPTFEPGTKWYYSNGGTQLLALIIRAETGMQADEFIGRRIFAPLGITDWEWKKDGTGTPQTSGGLDILPRDLAKLGALMLADGQWNGQRVLSHEWIEASTHPVQTILPRYSLLWWLYLDPQSHAVQSYSAIGSMGQFLSVIPAKGLIGVRMRVPKDPASSEEDEKFGFKDFYKRLDGVVQAGVATVELPRLLSQTGLYRNPSRLEISPDVMPYEPIYALWTDGARKARWIHLPPGSKIDTSQSDAWSFPVGTRLWKEFARDGITVETRLMIKTRPEPGQRSWIFGSYLWRRDQSDAELVSGKEPIPNALGTRHDIPSRKQCLDCHGGAMDLPLGVSPVQLSREEPEGNFTLPFAERAGLVTIKTGKLFTLPGTPKARAAIGYLHANCGHCHNPRGYTSFYPLNLLFNLNAQSMEQTNVFRTAVNVRASSSNRKLIARGSHQNSEIYVRMNRRPGGMPYLGSKEIDPAGLQAIRDWAGELGGEN